MAQPWARAFRRQANGDVEDPEEDRRANMRRLIEEGTRREDCQDEPRGGDATQALEAPPGKNQDQSPRVQAPSILDTGNEWRDQGEGRES